MNDTATFGPFIHSFLTEFRDELVKLPCLSFPFLSNTLSWNPDVDDVGCVVLYVLNVRSHVWSPSENWDAKDNQ